MVFIAHRPGLPCRAILVGHVDSCFAPSHFTNPLPPFAYNLSMTFVIFHCHLYLSSLLAEESLAEAAKGNKRSFDLEGVFT